MNAMNLQPLLVVGMATLVTLALALWARGEAAAAVSLRRGILALDRITTGLATALACLALLVAFLAGFWQVVARFATETPSVWSEALVRMALIWMAFIGVATALRAGALVSIDVAHRLSSGALRQMIEAMTLACNLALLGIMLWFGWLMTQRVQFQEMAGLEVPMSWGYVAIPIGAGFALVGVVAHFLDRRAEELEAAV
jgi:TRAP-type C4-dicarboxylate transport system permease small subunit